jgi:hypothetical protein
MSLFNTSDNIMSLFLLNLKIFLKKKRLQLILLQIVYAVQFLLGLIIVRKYFSLIHPVRR